jgi:hypothetical protein
MEDRRRFTRYQTHIQAQYFLKEKKDSWEECTIIDVSRKGMGIVFLTPENIDIGTTILLEIPMPTGLEPIHIVGILKWIKQSGNCFIGGIESTEILADLKLYYSPLEP